MTVNVTDTETSKTTSLQGHRAPVLSVALDPKMEYVVSCFETWNIMISDVEKQYSYKR